MNLSKTDAPFNHMIDNLFNSSISDFLGADFTRNQPAVNIIEGEQDFTIVIAAPGFSKNDFNIELKENKLAVSAEIKKDKEAKNEDFTKREFNYGTFKRSFHLPKSVDADSIKASYKEGMLKIGIAKKEPIPEISKSIKIS